MKEVEDMASIESQRIKEVREKLGLSQKEFAERIDMKRNSIAQIETGIRNPSDRTLKAICKEFGINYSWLKDGIGEMESDFKDSILDDLVKEYDLDETDRLILENYMKLDKTARKALSDYLRSLTTLWQDEH